MSFLSRKYKDIKPTSMMRMAALAAQKKGAIDLTLGEPDIATPADICEALAASARAGETHYQSGMGLPSLREAAAQYWKGKYGLDYAADDVLVTTGGSHAIALVLQACLDPGDEVIIFEPYFTFYELLVKQNGGIPVCVECSIENAYLPDPAEAEAAVSAKTKIMIVNSPCNPTGARYPADTMQGIASVAERHGLLVISDELYEAFAYDGPHIPMASLPDMMQRTVTIGGFSKSYAMTGWRVGYAMSPDRQLLKAMQAIGVAQVIGPNTMAQHACDYALRNCGAEIKMISELYRKRSAAAAEYFGAIPGIKCIKPGGSFYLFMDVSDTGMDGETFAVKMLNEADVVMIPGDSFGKNCRNFVRIACTVCEEKLKEAADRTAAALKR